MKKIVVRFLAVGVLLGAVCCVLWILSNLSLGYVFPSSIREKLVNPMPVSEIREEGLRLGNGRIVPVPWIRRLPRGLPILKDAVSQGVEVDDAGHVFGLIRIHHWCGNDPVKKHLARVNLSDMLIACGAETIVPIPDWLFNKQGEIRYTQYGWNISDYLGSRYISRMMEKEMTAEPATPPYSEPAARPPQG